MTDKLPGRSQFATVELHLEGTRSVVMWDGKTPHTPPPRVVLYSYPGEDTPRTWQFYRFTKPRITGNRAAFYRAVVPFVMAPGEYKEGK